MREVRGGATAVASCLLLALVLAAGCRQTREPVQLPPAAYRAVVTSFYTGLAAMQTSQDALARESFDRVTKTAPQEPAGWADFGLLLLRQQETEAAMPLLAKAGELAPDNGAIQRLLALSESRRGNLDASIAHWRKALEIDPDDAKAAYALAQETERQGGPDADAAAGRLLEALAARHDNLVARVDAARLAAKRGDAAALKAALAPLAAASSRWPEEVRARFLDVQQAAAGDPHNAATATAFLKNTLLRVPECGPHGSSAACGYL